MRGSFRWRAVAATVSLTALALAVPAGVGVAQVPDDVTASFTGPTPNPVPAGGTASVSATFTLAEDVGPITVSIELQGDTAGTEGTLRHDPGATSSALTNCTTAAPPTIVSCDWDGEAAPGPQTLAVFVDVTAATPPNTGWGLAARVQSGPGGPFYIANTGIFVAPPAGSTSLSGRVITTGGVPVEAACIFVMSSQFVFATITDAAGNWSLDELPDDYEFVVAAIPPFEGSGGPCNNEGPPPVPGPGELQPEFFDNIWIDLADDELVTGDPYAYAIERGAVNFTDTASGIESCLTREPGTVTPRPPCLQVPPTTTTTTEPAPTTTAAPTTSVAPTTIVAPTTTTPATLPATGSSSGRINVAALALVAVGALALLVARRRSMD